MEEKEIMMIPEHCTKEGEFVEGYGKKEFLRNLIFLAIGVVIGIIVFIFNKEFISIVLCGVASAVCGYVFCIKDRYSRMSLIDSLIDMYKFSKSQKLYEYRRGK